MIKNCLAIHDLCCYSKSSLTVVIPIMEMLEIEVSPLPTALLSSQTDGFDDFFFKELTKSMVEIFSKLKKENVDFSCIYSGFLGNHKQVELVFEIIKYFKEKNNSLIVIDPVLGDDQKLYSTIDNNHLKAMKKLISVASIITPNATEAALLVDITPKECYTEKELHEILFKLSINGPQKIIITSVNLADSDNIFTVCYENEQIDLISSKKLPFSFPGTGDLFTSVLTAQTLHGKSLKEAAVFSHNLCYQSLINSKKVNKERKRGISTIEVMKLIENKF